MDDAPLNSRKNGPKEEPLLTSGLNYILAILVPISQINFNPWGPQEPIVSIAKGITSTDFSDLNQSYLCAFFLQNKVLSVLFTPTFFRMTIFGHYYLAGLFKTTCIFKEYKNTMRTR